MLRGTQDRSIIQSNKNMGEADGCHSNILKNILLEFIFFNEEITYLIMY